MKELEEFTDQELREELGRRKEAKKALLPEPLPGIHDFSELESWCLSYVEEVRLCYLDYDASLEEEDIKQNLFEIVIEAVYGKEIWEWIRERS